MRSLEQIVRDAELLCDEAYKPQFKCGLCKGESIIENNKICPKCNGTGRVSKEELGCRIRIFQLKC